MPRAFVLTALLLCLNSCGAVAAASGLAIANNWDAPGLDASRDYHSFANPEQVRVTHLDLNLSVDFAKQQLIGSVVHKLQRQPGSTQLVLDTRQLKIASVEQGRDGSWSIARFRLDEPQANLGQALRIELDDEANEVRINYATSPGASGLQWLAPQQTAGKKQPFLYTQAQAIHARTFIPLQDSPAVRVTYTATIFTPRQMRAVMSAANDPQAPRTGVFQFDMPQRIPAYLIALAVGDLQFKAMGKRTGVYAEAEILEAAAAEFADTETMLEAVELRFGDYAWDRYDLLIVPPSYPMGGMENPRLSFITPTVIAGDKSLVALIAHELAHSWSGNTVTNATWRDTWLNEGFTTYLTYRIMEDVYGKARSDMERVLGYQDLQADMASTALADQRLTPDLRGRDPDVVFTNIPYEKGALLVSELEHAVGREVFDEFLRQYFAYFAFQSITTDQFTSFLEATLAREMPDRLSMQRVREWIEQPDIPQHAPLPTSDAFAAIDVARSSWLAAATAAADIDVINWSVHEWLYFLNNMPAQLTPGQLSELDQAFALTASGNNEIVHSWLLIAIRHDYQPAWPRLQDYLTSIGRRKLIVPLYRALLQSDQGSSMAQAIYAKARPGYHVTTSNIIDALMEKSATPPAGPERSSTVSGDD